MITYSPVTNSFYIRGTSTTLPDDEGLPENLQNRDITPEEHMALINGQTNDFALGSDENGDPVLVDTVYTDEEIVAMRRATVSEHINDQATSLGFDSIISAVSYADEPADLDLQAVGLALRAWRSQCWAAARVLETAFMAGGDPPTDQQVLDALPEFSMS